MILSQSSNDGPNAEESRQALKVATEAVRAGDEQIRLLTQELDRSQADWRAKEELLHQERQKLDNELRRLGAEREQKVRQLETQYAERMSLLEQQFSTRKIQLDQEVQQCRLKVQQANERLQVLSHQRRDAERRRSEVMQRVPHSS